MITYETLLRYNESNHAVKRQIGKKLKLTPKDFYNLFYVLIDTPRLCLNEECKNAVKFRNYKEGYGLYCSGKCRSNHDHCKAAMKKTNLEKYGCVNVFQSTAIKEKIKKTMLENHGVEFPSQSAIIMEKKLESSYKTKRYVTPSGKIWFYQGYENKLFDELLTFNNEEDIITEYSKMPSFWYIDNMGISRKYYPDCFIEKTNTIYEVKSDYTLKEGKKNGVFDLKKKSVIDSGYNFTLKVFK